VARSAAVQIVAFLAGAGCLLAGVVAAAWETTAASTLAPLAPWLVAAGLLWTAAATLLTSPPRRLARAAALACIWIATGVVALGIAAAGGTGALPFAALWLALAAWPSRRVIRPT
jgi:hypothetical protein